MTGRMDATHHRRLRGMRIAPGRFGLVRRCRSGSGKDQQAEGPLSLQPEKETTCGLWQSRPSSKPLAASAIAPDRVVAGVEILRHTSAHKGARCSTGGHRHRIPSTEGSPDGSPRRDRPGVRRPFTIDRTCRSMESRQSAIRGEMAFSSRARCRAARTHLPLQKGRAGESRGCGRLAPPFGTAGVARGIRRRQDALGKLAACAAPALACRWLSIGSVPLQSG